MIPATWRRRLIAPFSALVLMSGIHAASAQEISEAHLEAARAAISAINATEQFDEILPNAARSLKGELIQKDPNLEALITKTVDDKAFGSCFPPRRSRNRIRSRLREGFFGRRTEGYRSILYVVCWQEAFVGRPDCNT